jgi:phosphate-selective porin OprO/OprP
VETDDGKDVSGRFIVRPFKTQPITNPLKGLGLAISASAGHAKGAVALPAFRTQTLQQPYFSYVNGANAAIGDGTRTRYSPQVWYYYKAFGGWGEYVHTTTPITRDTVTKQDIDHDAWQVAASWVLTGEAATDAGIGVRPRNNFDFGNGHWGAFQIAARYHVLEVERAAVALGLAAAGSSRKAAAFTAGLRWYLNGNVWYTFNFERTAFDGEAAGPRQAENGIAFRTQLNF